MVWHGVLYDLVKDSGEGSNIFLLISKAKWICLSYGCVLYFLFVQIKLVWEILIFFTKAVLFNFTLFLYNFILISFGFIQFCGLSCKCSKLACSLRMTSFRLHNSHICSLRHGCSKYFCLIFLSLRHDCSKYFCLNLLSSLSFLLLYCFTFFNVRVTGLS